MRKSALFICAFAIVALPGVAGAELKPVTGPTVSPTVVPQFPTPQIKVSGGSLKCGSPSSSTLVATFTNTSATASNSYTLNWETIQQGACTKWDPTKNSNGTACSGGGFCSGYCMTYGPDVVKNYKESLTLDKGASKVATMGIPNAAYKKTEVRVTQTGITIESIATVSGSSQACLF
jgi:hypothetical protein